MRRAAQMARRGWTGVALWSAVAIAAGCEERRSEPGVPSATEPSPNASILPAPLAAGPSKATARDAGHVASEGSADAGAPEPPRPIREDDSLPPEGDLRPAPGVTLSLRFRWLEPPPPRAPEGNPEALGKARDKVSFDATLELSSLGRLRLSFDSRAFPLPRGSELRARTDRYGHILVWPNGSTYSALAPGTLRAALGEGRLDALPLADPLSSPLGSGTLLGLPTERKRIETSIGRLDLEQASMPPAAGGGALFCRTLLELLAVAPDSALCRPDWVPLRAEYTWANGSRFEVDATKLTRRQDIPLEDLAVPPSGAAVRRGELPSVPFVALIEEHELGEFHTRALPPPEKPDPRAPKLGLVFLNRADGPRYLVVDGVPLVWLRAGAEWLVSGLKPGRYAVQARDFFGAESTPPRSVELPARFVVGDEPER